MRLPERKCWGPRVTVTLCRLPWKRQVSLVPRWMRTVAGRPRCTKKLLPTRTVLVAARAWVPATASRATTSPASRSFLMVALYVLGWPAVLGLARCIAQEGAGDDEPLDLARALVDLGHLGVAVVALGRELLRVAVAAEDLDRLAGLAAGDGAREQLRLRALDAVRPSGLLEPRRAPDQRARRLDLGLHVGQLVLDRLKAGDRPAEGRPLARVAGRQLQGGLRDADRLRGDPDAPRVERGQRDAHPLPGLAQALARRVVEREVGGRGGVQAHLVLLARDGEALGAGAHHERADAVVLAREDEERGGVRAVRAPLLGAADAPAGRPRAHGRRVRARAGLGQRERADLLAGGQRMDVRRAVFEQRQRARAGVDGDGDADARVGARELLQHEDVAQEVRPRTALRLGHADAHEPEPAELGEQLARERVLAVPARRVRGDPLVGEPAREVAD